MRWNPVVKNLARLRSIQTHQKLHQRRLPCPGRPHKSNRVSTSRAETDLIQGQRRRTLMLKTNLFKLQRHKFLNRLRIGRLRIARRVENLLKVLQRDFRFAIDIDDVPQLLQRCKNEKRINHQCEKLSDGDLLAKNQIEHQKQNAGAQRVDGRSLDETQAAQVFHFLKLELQNLSRDPVQPPHFLMRQPEALHQFNIAQRLGCGTRQRCGFGNNSLLHLLDPLAQHRADNSKQGNGDQKRRSNRPMYAEGVDHHEDDANDRNEQHVNGGGNKPLHVAANFLQFAQSLATALVFEDLVGQIERMLDAIRVHARAQPLHDHVHEIVLEVLRSEERRV